MSTFLALGFVGNTTRGVRDCLLWALHYEKRHQMREAACEAIQRIGLSDQEIISTMQDMLVVEENVNVKRSAGYFFIFFLSRQQVFGGNKFS